MMTVAETPTFGKVLCRLRLARGLTQEELAARAGMSVRGISDLERGLRRRPQATTVSGLADALTLTKEEKELFEWAARASFRMSAQYESPSGGAIDHTSPDSPWALDGKVLRRLTRWHGTLPGRGLLRITGRPVAAVVAAIVIASSAGWILSNHRQGTQNVRAAGIPAAGAPLWAWSGAPSDLRPLRNPRGIAVDAKGSVYVGDATTSRITRFSASGRLMDQWGEIGSGPGQLRSPRGMAVDRLGDLYVADSGNGRVTEFSSSGKPLGHWGPGPSHSRDRFLPSSVAVSTNGLIFVVNRVDHQVDTFYPDGSRLARCCSGLPGFLPSGIAVSPATLQTNETVYVTDAGNETVRMLPLDGTWPEGYFTGAGPGTLSSPEDVAIDTRGTVYVLDSVACHVVKFSPTGDFLHSWGRCGNRPGQFRSPQGIAVDRRGDLYIADTGNRRVQKLSSSGKPLTIFKVQPSLTQHLDAPRGLAVTPDGTIYVADIGNDRILALSSRGVLVGSWGGFQHFAGPTGVALSAEGVAYVAEPYRNRIESFIPVGRNRTNPRPFAESPTGFYNPTSVAVDAHGNLYVADTLHDWVQEFTPSGTILAAWHLSSIWTHINTTAPAQTADAVAVGPVGNLYVADASRDWIVELSPEKKFLGRWGGTGSGPGEMLAPAGLTVDSEGRVYVADTGNNRIDQFSSSGTFLKSWGTEGSGLGEFRSPSGVAVDSNGNVYVADTGNNRIQRFSSFLNRLEVQR